MVELVLYTHNTYNQKNSPGMQTGTQYIHFIVTFIYTKKKTQKTVHDGKICGFYSVHMKSKLIIFEAYAENTMQIKFLFCC